MIRSGAGAPGDTNEGDTNEGDADQERLCRSEKWLGRFLRVVIKPVIFSLPLLWPRASPSTDLSPRSCY